MATSAPRLLPLLRAAALLSGCGGGATAPDVTRAVPIDGVWRATEAGIEETTLLLSGDGTTQLVRADFVGSTCSSSAGRWTVGEGRVELRVTARGGTGQPEVLSFDYEASQGRLVLTDGVGSTTFVRATRVPSCVSYGFGSWEGTFSARIDGVPRTFTNLAVDTEQVLGGSFQVRACFDTTTSCALDDVVLLIQVNASSALTSGTYALGDIATGFYGFVNLFPDDPDFPGFDSLRLTPTGSIELTTIAEDRVVATFEFRANERASNAAPAPDGSTFAQVTAGVVNLEYR